MNHGLIEIYVSVGSKPMGRLQVIDSAHEMGRKGALRRASMAVMRWADNYPQFRDAKFFVFEDGVNIA